jgi:parvulin-like peptidyl-prolyl isomerase
MTFRAKPVVKRAHRPAWEAQDRRNFYLNVGFGLIVLVAVIILGIAAGLSYYSEHLASVGGVDGVNISKDQFNERKSVETWRLDEQERRIRTAVLAGHLTEAQATVQQQVLTQQRNQLDTITLERLIDQTLQAKLAAQEGVTVTPADVDAGLVTEATSPESRHAWVIEVKPASDLGGIAPNDAQKAAARAKAEAAIKDIAGGKSWDDVAKIVSTDAGTASQSGDLGWIKADDTLIDEPFLKAVFASAEGTPTAVIEGTDGIYRIGRATEINPASVDQQYTANIKNDKIDLTAYRTAVEGDVIHQKLQDKIVADQTGAAPQRRASEIYIANNNEKLGGSAIKVRHILYSPNDDPAGAAKLAADDPAWALAEAQATATYQKIQAQPDTFDSIARTESDEGQARGAAGSGGKLPYFDQNSGVDAAFKAAIFAPEAKPGALLKPVRTAFGWHVIQVMYGPTDLDHLAALKTQADGGADFGALARDSSEAQRTGPGGDLGWVAKGQLDDRLTAAIFAAPIGKTSDPVAITDDGVYLFKVFGEETRTPEGRQLETIKTTAFSSWYQGKKAAANITRDATKSGSAG